MPRRQFTDAKGVEWEVYDVVVRPGPSARYPAHSQQLQPAKAWLVFESARERRRLSPFPIAWDEAPQEELERYLAIATQVSISVRRPE
jgi:hypothetical protein